MAVMQSFRNFTLQHYGALGTSVLTLLLILLEKSMESEFACPSDPVFSSWYTAVFIVMPALVLWVLGFQLSGVKCKLSCRCVFQTLYGPLLWICILLSDGRYVACFATSNARQISQVASMGLILILGLIYLCKCGTRSEFLETKHKENIRRHIQKALDEYKEEKIEDFVKQQVNEQLKSWNPELLNAEEESVEISINLRKEVVGKLNRPEGPSQTPGAADIAGGPSQTPGAADIAGGPPQTPGAADIPLDQIQVETST